MKGKIIPILLVFIVILLVVIVSQVMRGSSIPLLDQINGSAVSGQFDINGVVPDDATISITQKKAGSLEKASVFASGLPVTDKGAWAFTTAKRGESYEIQAEVIVGGEMVVASSPISVTAPADDETLVLNIPADAGEADAIISGNIEVSGYIPLGSTINVKGRQLGDSQYTTIGKSLPGQAKQFMSYTSAISGVAYEVEAVLLNSAGVEIGKSSVLSVVAPATDEVITINSNAQAPANAAVQNNPTPQQPGVNISGSINFNGAAPGNSRIVILQHGANSTNYQVAVDNITPVDGATWTWNGAQNSTWYTMTAVLKQRQSNGTDLDIADSAPLTIAAPANNLTFTINSGMSLSAPPGPVTVTCTTYNGGPNQNNWNVTVYFQSVFGGQSYWYQIGSTNGASDVMNSSGNSNGAGQQQVSATFNNNTTYYARYAYANVANQSTGSSQYSGFSGTTPLQCSH